MYNVSKTDVSKYMFRVFGAVMKFYENYTKPNFNMDRCNKYLPELPKKPPRPIMSAFLSISLS